jgi:hypothetical protein
VHRHDIDVPISMMATQATKRRRPSFSDPRRSQHRQPPCCQEYRDFAESIPA